MGKGQDYVVYLRAQNADLNKKLAQSRQQLKSFNGFSQKIGKEVATNFAYMFGASSVIGGVTTSIKKIAEFEYQMDKVAAVSRATASEVRKLTANALDLGAKSKFTATEIGSLQEELSRLGFNTEKITKMTDAARQLATVADAELAPSAKAVGQIINAFGLEATEATRIANTMAESFSSTALNLEEFTTGMSYAATAGKNTGFSLEQVTAMLGTLVDAGIQGSKAGTALRDIFADLDIKGISLNEALKLINSSTNKNKTAFDLFGKVSMNAAVILAEQEQKVTALTSGFADMNREMVNMTKVMEDNLLTDWKLFTSAIDGTIQKGGVLTPVLREITQSMTRMVSAVNSGDMKKLGVVFAGMASGDFISINKGLKKLEEFEDKIAQLKDKKNFDLQTEAIEIFKLAQEDGIKTTDAFMAKQMEFVHASRLPEERFKILKGVLELYDKQLKENTANLEENATGNKKRETTLSDLEAQLKSLQEQQKTATFSAVAGINDQISKVEELIKQYKEATNQVGSYVNALGQLKGFGSGSDQFSKIFEGIDSSAFGKDMFQLQGVGDDNPIQAKLKMQMEAARAEAQTQVDALNAVLSAGVAEGIAEFADGFATGGLENAFSGLFEVIGGGLQTLGKSLIAFGVSMEAFKDAFKGNPLVAIAAGTAAVITGALVKQAASNLSASSTGGGGAYGGGGSSSGQYGFNSFQTQDAVELRIEGEFKLKNSELVAAVEREQKRRSRLRG